MRVRDAFAIGLGIFIGVGNCLYVSEHFSVLYALCVGWLMGFGAYVSVRDVFK